jgi:hypothetical protein
VTIAQAIDESGWGQSQLATQDHNLFGIKGTGPAGSVLRPTQEYQNGQQVSVVAPFRVYSSVAQSISDHTLLLATGSSYKQAMADRRSPDAFANDLTGIYATDPSYGSTLIRIMRQYNLYRYDAAAPTAQAAAAGSPTGHNAGGPGSAGQGSVAQGALGQSGLAQTGLAQTGLAQAGSGPGGASAGAQPAPAGQRALIPGAVDVNPTALGLAAPPATGHGTAGQHATPVRRGPAESDAAGSGTASIPGLDAYAGTAAATTPATGGSSAHLQPSSGQALRAGPRNVRVSTRRYVAQMPRIVTTDFITTAKTPLLRAKPLYQDVAADSDIRWELVAACDWMQCQAQPRISPVHGEKLGTRNADGTVYRTKSEALEQVAADLIELAAAVYGINLRQRLILSIRDLANVFAAFRWGGLLKAHRISAMEFPYSVEGLTTQHMKMRWPDVGGDAPDKPGARFRMSFGAVPVVLGLSYPAIA